MKVCTKCNVVKEFKEFSVNNTKRDGFQTHCKPCQKTTYFIYRNCTICSKEFEIKHRNIKTRKSFKCRDCILKENAEKRRLKTQPYIKTTKGYNYVRDLEEKHSYKLEHRKIMEDFLGRKLEKIDIVHHIDGNKENNNISNLWLTTQRNHGLAHASLEYLAFQLIQNGTIIFDQITGFYKFKIEG